MVRLAYNVPDLHRVLNVGARNKGGGVNARFSSKRGKYGYCCEFPSHSSTLLMRASYEFRSENMKPRFGREKYDWELIIIIIVHKNSASARKSR